MPVKTGPQATNLKRRTKAGLYVAFGLAIALAGFAVCEWLEWPFLRRPVESALKSALKRDVTIGSDFGARFVGPLRLRTDLIVIGPAQDGPTLQGDSPELLRASGLRLTLPYATILNLLTDDDSVQATGKTAGARPHITSLAAERIDATLIRSADGQANWQFRPRDEKDTSPLVVPTFGRLDVLAGTIRIDDAVTQLKLETTVHSIEDSSLPASTDSRVSRVEISAKGSYREQKLSVQLRSDGLLALNESNAQATPVSLSLKARAGSSELDFDGSAHDILKFGGVNGKFRVAGPSLAAAGDKFGVTLPTTAEFVIHGHAVREDTIWSVDVGELSIGTSRLNGRFRYDPTLPVPKLTGLLAGARLSMPDLGPAFGTDGKRQTDKTDTTKKPSKSGRERVLPQREFDTPSLAAMNADVKVDLQEFELGTSNLNALAPLQAQITLDDRVLRISDLTGETADGRVHGTLSLDARRDIPLWNIDLRWTGIQLERFVKPRNVVEPDTARGYVSGILGGHAKLHGRGRSTARMLASLDGEMQFWVREGQISHFLVEAIGLDVAQALGMAVRGDAMLPVQCAVTALDVRQGNAEPKVAVIETTDTTVTAAGSVSLADEKLGLVFNAHPKDFSPMTLRSPLVIEGTFTDPDVRLDKSAIGTRLVAAAALAAVTPVAALLALFDLGDDEKMVCENAFERVRASPKTPSGSRRKP
jgi:uncharacterized protein involved in outer membrane biogenesis